MNPRDVALPDPGRNPHQGVERCLRLRQQVRPAPHLRLAAHIRAPTRTAARTATTKSSCSPAAWAMPHARTGHQGRAQRPDEKVVLHGRRQLPHRHGRRRRYRRSIPAEYAGAIELNAVQRANPEMQKRVANADPRHGRERRQPHRVDPRPRRRRPPQRPLGTRGGDRRPHRHRRTPRRRPDPLGQGNRRQRESGTHGHSSSIADDIPLRRAHGTARARSACMWSDETTGDHRFVFTSTARTVKPHRPRDGGYVRQLRPRLSSTTLPCTPTFTEAWHTMAESRQRVHATMCSALEAVACKDWLTNKVDRSRDRPCRHASSAPGDIQLPLSDCGVVALDYTRPRRHSHLHRPRAPGGAGRHRRRVRCMASGRSAHQHRRRSASKKGIKGVSLSANWMWPCKNPGEDAALYRAVEACSDFVVRPGHATSPPARTPCR